MGLVSTISVMAASFIANNLIDKGKDFLVDKGMDKIYNLLTSDRQTFIGRLEKVINDTIDDFKLRYGHNPDDGLQFYQSETLFQEILSMPFLGKCDSKKVMDVIVSDERIAPPSYEDVYRFLEMLFGKIKTDDKLKDLYVNENYKKEIFTLSNLLLKINTSLEESRAESKRMENSLNDLESKIDKLNNTYLATEWKVQLEEIRNNYKELKNNTALARIISLRERMESEGLNDNTIKARAVFIQAMCSQRSFNNDINKHIALLYVQAYNLVPGNKEYKEYACSAYLPLNEEGKARTLSDTLIEEDNFNLTGWLVRSYLNSDNILSFIEENVPNALKNRKDFQLNVCNWLLSRQRMDEVHQAILSGYSILAINQDLTNLQISYRNLTYWSVWSAFTIIYYFSQKKDFKTSSIKDDLYNPEEIRKIRSVIELILNCVRGSEIESDFHFLRFQFHYCNLLEDFSDVELDKLSGCYEIMHRDEGEYTITFQYVRALVASGKDANAKKAITLIDTQFASQQVDILILFKIDYYVQRGEIAEASKQVEDYFSSIKEIDELNIVNIFTVSRILANISKENLVKCMREVVAKPVKFELLSELISVKADILENEKDREGLKSRLDDLKSKFNEFAIYLKRLLLDCYLSLNLKKEAAEYLAEFVDIENFSYDVVLYCRLLYAVKEKRVELQNILEQFRRKDIVLSLDLVQADLEMARAQYDYVRTKEICLYALQFYKVNSNLVYTLFMSFYFLGDRDGMLEYSHLLKPEFISSDNKLAVPFITILTRNGLINEAMNLMFDKAKDESNTEFRQFYISQFLTNPMFSTIEDVEVGIGTTVIYKIDSDEQQLTITEENVESKRARVLMGRKAGETLSVQSPQPLIKHYNLEILQVHSKFKSLFDEIMAEAEDPLSGFTFRQFKFAEAEGSSGIDDLKKILAENYGAEEDIRNDQVRNVIERYNRNEITFFQLCHSVFADNIVDTFLYLCSNSSDYFRLPPAVLYKDVQLGDKKKFVLDIPSLLLFFELETNFGLKSSIERFIVPNTSVHAFMHLLGSVKAERHMVGKLSVRSSNTKGILYSEEYHEKKIAYYGSILEWIDKNCETVIVRQRIEYIDDLNSDSLDDIFLQSVMDNMLLCESPDYCLVCADMYYHKTGSFYVNSMVSPELFARHSFTSADFERVKLEMLKMNMVGLTLDEEIIKTEFLKRSSQAPHSYDVCLKNLAIGWNDNTNIAPAISHIRWLTINGAMPIERKAFYIEEVLMSILPGARNNRLAVEKLQFEITSQFKLLPDEKVMVNYCLRNAIGYINSGKKRPAE